jgi:hypothetical protein
MLFNAADILYGSSSVSVDLTQAELRSKTDWMISVNYPLGFFSFAEAVFLPSMTGKAQDMGVGGRFYANVGETKVEGGYLTKVETTRVHKLYTSLQGNIGPDWHLASSITIDQSNPSASDIQKSWMISGGLFHMQYLDGDRNLSLRLEMLSRPFGTWSVFEGFRLVANIAAPFGESGDVLLPVSSSNALGMTLGASWIY